MTTYPLYPRRRRTDLAGFWDFQFIPQTILTLPDFSPSDWPEYPEKQAVPGCFDAAGKYAGARGIGVYRRAIQVSRKGRLRLELGGILLIGRIFLDGREIGFDPWPYSAAAFEFEAEAGIHELIIAVENRLNRAYNPLFLPEYAFYAYGGISRSIELMEMPCAEACFGRCTVTTQDVGTGRVRLDIEVENGKDGTLMPIAVQFDSGLAFTHNFSVRNGICSAEFSVPDPKPWSPESPALHTVRLITPDAGDELIERFGIRTIEAKNAKLLLNGKEQTLRGFNRHDAHPEFGSGVPPALMLEDLQILRSMHCNFIRGCHYPQNQAFLDLCDELGILVWEESLGWGNSKDCLKDPLFHDRQIEQTALMVRNSRNHPSVIIRAFMNEVDSTVPEARAFLADLVKTVKDFDTSRPVTFASNHVGRGDICLDLVDIISCNTYPGWYETYLYEEDCKAHVGPRFDELEKAAQAPGLEDKPIIISELGAAALFGCHDRARIPWSEEFQADLLEEACRQFALHPRFSGLVFWQFADTRSRIQGGSNQARGFNNKGVLDEYRREKLAADVIRKAFAEMESRQKK